MKTNASHKILLYIIATVWLANGLFCKVLNLVPRHTEIVARILGADYARPLTIAIGCSEILMMVWVLSGIRARWCAIVQAVIIATMNIIEYTLVPDLLLWGHLNIVFAFAFIAVILYNEFVLNRRES
ncbi:MAG: DoxX-like family protein [Bacteroidetes bacterium]|nr:DoxX-like family protein [Bacteroidota bacterium]